MIWKIREIEIPNKLVLAPMAGITNEAFRIICKEMGGGLVTAEMLSDKAISFKNEKTIKMSRVNPLEHPLSMQIFGSEVESLVKAAKFIDECTDADIIDINMGCPVNKVAKKSKAGASLLKDPNNVYLIVKSVVEAVKKPVTVKIRSGWDFDSINAVENAKMIELAGASAITIHGRTRSQFYSGTSDLNIIKAVKEAVKIPVIGNGDITSGEDALNMLTYTKCDAVMIGRAALGDPWIFARINAFLDKGLILTKPDKEGIFKMILKQYELLRLLKDEKIANLEMRSHVMWYIKGLPGSAKIKDLVCKQSDFSEVIRIIKSYFNL